MLDAPKAFSKDTDEQIKKWISDALERPGSFGLWREHPRYDEMFQTWSLGPVIETRDSDVLDRANAEALRRHLATDPTLADDWYLTEANHWAVGWVTHLSFRVVDPDGTPSRMARVVREWFDALADYPIANESLHSEMECEAAEEWWRQYQERETRREVTKYLQANLDTADPDIVNGRDVEAIKDAIEEQIDAIPDETFWEIAVHRDGNGREINSDGSYVIRDHEVEEIADAILERGLVTI